VSAVKCYARLVALELALALAGCDGPAGSVSPSASPPRPACGLSDITLDQLKARPDGDEYVHIVGRIINNCHTATGVQLKIVLLDRGGNILKVDDLWPASTNNIPPQSDFPFDMMIKSVPSFDRFQVRVTEVRIW
jgi:hypothetical protein